MRSADSSGRWRETKRLFDSALSREAGSRTAFLDQACDGDPELRADVESLLASHERVPSFLETPAAELLDEECERDLIGGQVGAYRIVRRIASGGMGTVYLAERADDAYRKRVAIKLLRGGIASPDGIRRFVDERQTLAILDHPSIAKLLDGGTTEDGRPYLVMEYVDGVPIDAHCERRNLGVEGRLRLFLQVCDAVHHAHRSLVVHRDLKPANILVTSDGLPKLLDFGIATLVDRGSRNPAGAGAEETALPFGSAGYASPEQSRAEPATTASDVFSLGVILRELLTGSRPGRANSANRLAGDLEAIVLRALRPDPSHRYPSVDRFAEDVRRHLEDWPVSARPRTFGYLASKFVRRNRVGTAAAALVLLSISAGVIGTASQARVATRERDAEQAQRRIAEANMRRADEEASRARDEAAVSDRVTGFLVDLFRTADPWQSTDANVTARRLLDRGAESLVSDSAAPARVRSALLLAMGRVYSNLGLYDRAKELLRAAVDLGRGHTASGDPAFPRALDALGMAHWLAGEPEPAAERFQEALAIFRRNPDDHASEIATELNNIALVRQGQGDVAAAEGFFLEALAIRRALDPGPGDGIAGILNNLGGLCFTRGEFARAEGFFRESLELNRERFDGDHPAVARSLDNVGLARQGQCDLAEAERLHRSALEMRERRLGPDHPDVATSLNNLASVLYSRGEPEAAGALFRRALDIVRGRLGDDHPTVIQLACNLGAVHYSSGDDEEATRLWTDALERRRRLLPADHPEIATPLALLAEVRFRHREFGAAMALLDECLAIRRAAYPPGHLSIAGAENLYGAALMEEGRYADAERLLVTSLELMCAAPDSDADGIRVARERVVDLYRRWGLIEKASRYAGTESTPSLRK